MENEILDILFLTYLTDYNIKDINLALLYPSIDNFIEDYIRHNSDKNIVITSTGIDKFREQAQSVFDEMTYNHIQFMLYSDPAYPKGLNKLLNQPPVIYYKGVYHQKRNVAVVGTRKISQYAEKSVQEIVDFFVSRNFGVVSGLAYGIDQLAHSFAIKAKAYTIAILPNSVNYIYPKEHYRLANEILQHNGCILSELPIGINRGRRGFVERNRLQTAVSEYVIPVEMNIQSGTMHTVNFAIKQEKDLLLLQPDEKQKLLEQYSGILHLIENEKYKHKFILKSISELDTQIQPVPDAQLSLF